MVAAVKTRRVVVSKSVQTLALYWVWLRRSFAGGSFRWLCGIAGLCRVSPGNLQFLPSNSHGKVNDNCFSPSSTRLRRRFFFEAEPRVQSDATSDTPLSD